MPLFCFVFISLLTFTLWGASLPASARTPICGAAVAAPSPSPIDKWVEAHPLLHFPLPEKLHVTVVIPVYREFENGNLYRLLRAFANQDAPGMRFDIVFVVNNSPRVASEKNRIWRENVATVAYLNSLREKAFPAQGDLVTANSVLEKDFAITTLDYTTPGIIRNIGAIRDLGVGRAIYQHNGTLKNLVVTHFDADSIPPREYISDILRAFSDPSVNSALFYMRFKIPRGSPPELHATFYRMRADYQLQDLHFALTRRNPAGGTPRITTRGFHLEKIGRVRHIDNAEDVALIQAAGGPSRSHRALWLHPILTSDRLRQDGYDALSRQTSLPMVLRGSEAMTSTQRSNYQLVRNIYDELHERISPNERHLLEEEVLHWRAIHRRQVEFIRKTYRQKVEPPPESSDLWETVETAQFWGEAGKVPALDWSDYGEGENGELSPAMEVNIYGIALSRFLQLGRDYPDRFPATKKYLNVKELAYELRHYTKTNDRAVEEYRRKAIAKFLSTSILDFEDLLVLINDAVLPLVSAGNLERIGHLLIADIPAEMTHAQADARSRCIYAVNASFLIENILINDKQEHDVKAAWNKRAEMVKTDAEALAVLTLAFPRNLSLDSQDFAIFQTCPEREALRIRLDSFSKLLSLNQYRQTVLKAAMEAIGP